MFRVYHKPSMPVPLQQQNASSLHCPSPKGGKRSEGRTLRRVLGNGGRKAVCCPVCLRTAEVCARKLPSSSSRTPLHPVQSRPFAKNFKPRQCPRASVLQERWEIACARSASTCFLRATGRGLWSTYPVWRQRDLLFPRLQGVAPAGRQLVPG